MAQPNALNEPPETRKSASAVEEYPDDNVNIRVSHQHDEDSASEAEDDEVARLRNEVVQLRNKITEYEDREAIPFEEVEEERQLREVVVQTQAEPAKDGESEDYWQQIAAKVQREHEDRNEAV